MVLSFGALIDLNNLIMLCMHIFFMKRTLSCSCNLILFLKAFYTGVYKEVHMSHSS